MLKNTAKMTTLIALSAALLSACTLTSGAPAQSQSPQARSPQTQLPASLNAGAGIPEDITVNGSAAFVSNFSDGSILKLDLKRGGAASSFVPASSDAYRAGWGLRTVPGKNWLLAIQNQPYDFKPTSAKAGRVSAYDLSSGAKVKSWDLPEATVGNSVDVDAAGNIYVGDIGPNPRIVKIDPKTDTVRIWATSDQWVAGGFGVGGMVYSGQGLYAAHNNALWYIGINADGRAAAPKPVKIEGNPVIFADGMTWTEGGVIYAENDVMAAGPHGTVYQVRFSDPLTGTRTALQTDLRDPSGVAVAKVSGRSYLLVNESQLGYAFGVDQGQPSTPYQVKVFPR